MIGNHPYAVLVSLYALTLYFVMHQTSHLMYSTVDFRVRLNPTLAFVMHLERIAAFLFLVWYGSKTAWYYPLALVAIGYPATIPLKIIEGAIKLHRAARAVSLSGILFVPILLYLMVAHVNVSVG